MNKDERLEAYKSLMPDYFSNKAVISRIDLESLGFFEAPASTKYHGSYDGGLFDHSLAVTKVLLDLTNRLGLKWSRPESPYIVGMYHDLCKCDAYIYDHDTDSYKYDTNQVLDGHGAKSVIVAQKYISLTDEEIACIRWHMGAFEKDPKMWEYYSRAIERYPNVLYTHTADMIASKIKGV